MSKKYYAVAVGRNPGIYESWAECQAQTDGYSNAKFKSFKSEEEARKFLNGNKAAVIRNEKVCPLCSRPMATRGELCTSCVKKKHKLEEVMFEYSLGRTGRISNTNLLFLKKKFNVPDIFDFINKHPDKYWDAFKAKRYAKRELKKEHKKYLVDNAKYKENEEIPDFVYSLLGPTKEVIKVYGRRTNPSIIYKCKRCGETLFTRYQDYLENSGHDCDGIKSSGELIVEEFLKERNIGYKTQRDTYKCINPDTGHVMPYDFELIGRRILIEVQGEQHRKFIPRFHVTEEGFEYQKKKDEYKREFAEQSGYKLLEIWYDDFDDDEYKRKILGLLPVSTLAKAQ